MNDKTYNVAVIGATGVVGEVVLDLLTQREFPVDQVYALASERSTNARVMMGSQPLVVQDVAQFDFSQVDLAFFCASREVSRQYAPIAATHGCRVIDNTSEFRYDEDVPLIVPEVNAALLAETLPRGIIANPNCSTIQMAVAIAPLVEAVGIKRINVATYQAVSGAGKNAIEELAKQTAALLSGQEIAVEHFSHQIAFNVFPHIDQFEENGYTREEMKMVWETQKIFNDNQLQINPTAVRVPVFYGHSIALHLETMEPIDMEQVLELYRDCIGLQLMQEDYPTPVSHAASQDGVFVGRVRQDISHPCGINMWVVADNVRKGAALNAIEIAELLVNRDRVMN